jgi:cyanamide hydratase family protein with HD domain
MSDLARRAKKFVSREHVHYVAKNEYEIPDSIICQKALELVSSCSNDTLLNHCFRTYAFGVGMAHKTQKPFDKELFFLGAIMHDLGLTEPFNGTDSFELEGARAAQDFCIKHNLAPNKAELVHEMIALHTSIGLAHTREPEIAMVHFGAGADVIGLWHHEINKKTFDEIVEQHPRLDFKNYFTAKMDDEIKRKPNSHLSTLVNIGFARKVNGANFAE